MAEPVPPKVLRHNAGSEQKKHQGDFSPIDLLLRLLPESERHAYYSGASSRSGVEGCGLKPAAKFNKVALIVRAKALTYRFVARQQ
jgi:hypothetical protein